MGRRGGVASPLAAAGRRSARRGFATRGSSGRAFPRDDRVRRPDRRGAREPQPRRDLCAENDSATATGTRPARTAPRYTAAAAGVSDPTTATRSPGRRPEAQERRGGGASGGAELPAADRAGQRRAASSAATRAGASSS